MLVLLQMISGRSAKLEVEERYFQFGPPVHGRVLFPSIVAI